MKNTTLKKSKFAIEYENHASDNRKSTGGKKSIAVNAVQSTITYDQEGLVRLLEEYRDGEERQTVADLAMISRSAYSAYLKGKKRPSEVTLIQLALYHKLDYEQAAKLLAAGGYNIECKTSFPMAVFTSFLKLRETDEKLYTDPEFFIEVCKKIAETEHVELKDQIFKK